MKSSTGLKHGVWGQQPRDLKEIFQATYVQADITGSLMLPIAQGLTNPIAQGLTIPQSPGAYKTHSPGLTVLIQHCISQMLMQWIVF